MLPDRLNFCSVMVPRAITSLTGLAITAVAVSMTGWPPLRGINPHSDVAQSSSPLSQESDPDPTDFSAEELEHLQRRFGVHGPQTQLAQLFTRGVDQLQPLRANTLSRLHRLKPVIQREAGRHRINPMLITAILFDIRRDDTGQFDMEFDRADFITAGRLGNLMTTFLSSEQARLGDHIRLRLINPTPDRIFEIRIDGLTGFVWPMTGCRCPSWFRWAI